MQHLNFFLLESEENEFEYLSGYFEKIEAMGNQQFIETFRMSRYCFDLLLEKVSSYSIIYKARGKLYVFLYYLSHASTYRVMREVFGLPKSTIFLAISEISKILSNLAHLEIKFPDTEELESLEYNFRLLADIPGVILAIDGTHIEITKPKSDPFKYYNRKGTFSLSFVCVVDFKKRFRGITYNYGSCHDSRILRVSNLKSMIDSIPEGYFIVGDPAFSGFNKIKSTYSTSTHPLTPLEEKLFGRQRVIVENTFGLFKGKFRRFAVKMVNGEDEKGINLIKSGFWLHNFIIENDN